MENLSGEDLDDVKHVFKMLDVSDEGSILANEAFVGFLSLDCKMSDPSITHLLESHRDRGISFNDFQTVALKTMPSTWSKEMLRKCFRAIDLQNSGVINEDELLAVVDDLGLRDRINREMILDMISRARESSSSRYEITEQEFINLFITPGE